jgi:hypothetical protein
MNKRAIACAVAALLAVVAVIGAAVGIADNRNEHIRTTETGCPIGGQPNFNIPRVGGEGERLFAGPIVLACAGTGGNEVQIVGYAARTKDKVSVCFDVDIPNGRQSVGGLCKRRSESWRRYCRSVCILRVAPVSANGEKRTVVAAISSRSARSGVLTIERAVHGGFMTIETANARLSGPLETRLGENEPVLIGAGLAKRCVAPMDLRVTLRKTSGSVLRERGSNAPNLCST